MCILLWNPIEGLQLRTKDTDFPCALDRNLGQQQQLRLNTNVVQACVPSTPVLCLASLSFCFNCIWPIYPREQRWPGIVFLLPSATDKQLKA